MDRFKESITKNLWVIILAAGKGKRMNAKFKNKVVYEIINSG